MELIFDHETRTIEITIVADIGLSITSQITFASASAFAKDLQTAMDNEWKSLKIK